MRRESGARGPSIVPARSGPAHYLANLKHDAPASVVVFLVALPLCLGIAVACEVSPLAGLISGVVGGVVLAWASGSSLAVSGPAAGLITIVLSAIAGLGYEGFLLAVALSGLMQIGLGLLRAGIFAYYFPSSVIKGMLAAIGIILILKQIPHALGYDEDFEGDFTMYWNGDLGAWHEISFAFEHIHIGAAICAVVGLAILTAWARVPMLKRLTWLPGPLVTVIAGVIINAVLLKVRPEWAVTGDHLVTLPTDGIGSLFAELGTPAFHRITEPKVWTTAVVIALVASIETLLCIEAIDKLDPQKRSTSTNRELVAQGLGNLIAGCLGGLPITAVIVRGSANVSAGGKTRISAFLHGVLLLLAILLLTKVINLIPLAALAAVLLYVGYNLTRVEVYRKLFRHDAEQWVPFLVTVVTVVATDLLKGVGVGLVVAVFFILRANIKTPYFIHRREAHEEAERQHIRIELSENVSFLNKASVNRVLHTLPADSVVEISGSASQYIHPDVLELIHDFETTAHTRGIDVRLISIPGIRPGTRDSHH